MSSAGYDELARLAERELELAAGGSIEELERLAERRSALVGSLPASAPPSARAALERAAALQAQTSAALLERLRATAAALGEADRGRRAARSYAGAPARAARAIDSAA